MQIPEKYKMRKRYEGKLNVFVWKNPYAIMLENDFAVLNIVGVSNESGNKMATGPDSEKFMVAFAKKEGSFAPPYPNVEITDANPGKEYPRMALPGVGIFSVYEIVEKNGFTTEEKDIAYSVIAACDKFHSLFNGYWLT